ncbi:peptide-methionine (R)-S-oxide reductase MsrB [Croceicoccus gelatinilyticus]|uniref:peptide-methionine (R)-S-oxide reductase MsrB n=1 Tax=Croceicoccus gelatinilyticus TaxID=2835536 RepID=UPI001BCBAA98|nr:peptide-methionine (R)-S-oxide reductase MsrB [Croceicoccus gelatinilyticus]MBS7669475.1 peptide-methionine (R)-S-oxide reductase MsrB [Croceicoccus gelatinilyticus]
MGLLTRRNTLGLLCASAIMPILGACGSRPAEARTYPLQLSEDEWRKRLSREEFRILRQAGTERAFSNPLNDEKRKGTFTCAGCGQALFSSSTKYESGTGWPAFYAPLKGAVDKDTDYKLGYPRTEILCSNCGGHLGHVFNDGPKPTGKRYCINGVALDFKPA